MRSGARAAALTALAAILAMGLTLAGCVSAPPRPAVAPLPWSQQRSRLQALDPFELRGRVAVAAGNEGFDAHLTWNQRGARSTLELNGPLGVGGMRVVADGETLNVETSQGRKLASGEARAELTDKLGFEPPLGSLRYWVLGVPDPARPSIETVGADQRLVALEQDGWQIVYSAYMSAGGTTWLPQRLSLTRGDVRVRLVVEHWQA